MESDPGDGRRKDESFRPESEMGENTGNEVKCKAEAGRDHQSLGIPTRRTFG